jgi:hypothetical protein
VEGSHVLPSLLHEGDEEVDAHGDVLAELLLGHVACADGGAHAVDLLGLELDGLLQFGQLVGDLFTLGEVDGESVHLDEDVAEELGHLLADGVGGEQHVVLLGPLLDFVSVLIEGLEAVDVDEGDALSSGFLDMDGVGQDANLPRSRGTLIFWCTRLGSLTLPLNLLSGS